MQAEPQGYYNLLYSSDIDLRNKLVTTPMSKRYGSWLTDALKWFNDQENVKVARRVMNYADRDVYGPANDHDAYYFLKLCHYFKDFGFPVPADQRNCTVIRSLKQSIENERSNIARRYADPKLDKGFTQQEHLALDVVQKGIESQYAMLNCDVVIVNQQQQQQVEILKDATDQALQNPEGSGTVKYAMIAIVIIVVFLMIKKFRNG